MQVMDLLIKRIENECEITLLAQPNIKDEIKRNYPFIKVISIMDNFFNYESFCQNVKLPERFDVVYIPASGMTFEGYEEVFSILKTIKYKKLILFNGKGEESIDNNNIIKTFLDAIYFIFVRCFMKVVDVWYEHFGRKYKF